MGSASGQRVRSMIAKHEVDAFWRDGFIVAESAVDRRQLTRLRAVLAEWVDESRDHDAPFGEPTTDGRPRFDLAPRAQREAARVAAGQQSQRDRRRLLGGDARFGDDRHGRCPHRPPTSSTITARSTSKLPGSNTEVRYHPGLRLHAAHERRCRDRSAHARRHDARERLPHGGARQPPRPGVLALRR